MADTRPEEYRGVLLVADPSGSGPQAGDLQVLGKGREIADQLGVYLSVILFDAPGYSPREWILYGADRVYLSSRTAGGNVRKGVDCVEAFIRKESPEILLFSAGYPGNEIAGRLAERFRVGLVPGCRNLAMDIESRLLVMTRSSFGGKATDDWTIPEGRPQMATLAEGIFPEGYRDEYREGEVITI